MGRKKKYDRREIANYVKKGNSNITKVAEHFECSRALVRSACKEYGVKVVSDSGKPAGNLKSTTYMIIRDLVEDKFNQQEIADRYRLPKSNVTRIHGELKRAGVLESIEKLIIKDFSEFEIAYQLLKHPRKHYSNIAAETGSTSHMVSKVRAELKNSGLEDLFRSRGKKSLNISGENTFSILERIAQNPSKGAEEISKETSVSLSTIQKIVKRAKDSGLMDRFKKGKG